MSLTDYSENELREELQRREAERELRDSIQVVLGNTPVQDVEARLTSLAQSYLEDELKDREIDTQWAYEEIMQLVFGQDIFSKINRLRR
ncbi:hypothetical protein [Vibrio phage XZ1]|uniref:Uncharacterized protein n=1 Tax=Vibrio phage VH7D TaxID=1262539 RepID=V9LZD5_9CAUD|nr:hypothetical protein CF80_gp114 [Vibrio phage VH7D]QBX06245.1 hypothetical protein Va3_292 [Vibrio phage Va3]QNJ54871.1 hypothetical protein vBValMR10Z_331 [Vibrio phage vB_ValM_R10Z]QNJ55257.1 hypothetical protein vBValMR11Z_331 [Vibrio phage vB_ValM_R11Z]UOL51298.1 hypothetical protein [Vibrio phage XZ1]URQ03431.1 hypothetical protein PVA23_54 [Vibrio phage PVA23]